jgi:hypothetical protein
VRRRRRRFLVTGPQNFATMGPEPASEAMATPLVNALPSGRRRGHSGHGEGRCPLVSEAATFLNPTRLAVPAAMTTAPAHESAMAEAAAATHVVYAARIMIEVTLTEVTMIGPAMIMEMGVIPVMMMEAEIIPVAEIAATE